MRSLERILERAKADPKRIVFPESADPRVLAACGRLAREGIAKPVLFGDRDAIVSRAESAGVDLSGVAIEGGRDAYASIVRESLAERVGDLDSDPVYLAAAMVRAGDAHGFVSGAAHTTADTVRAALRVLRPGDGVKTVSSFFLMELRAPTPAGEQTLAFADSGLVPYPDADQLAEIALRTADSFRTLVAREPRVAFLSFSTKGSAAHESVETVRAAVDRLHARGADFAFDGELQGDAALVPEIAASKAPGSRVAGTANVLIFPNLDAGNIAYKLVERLAGAQAIGPLLQGLALPANDLSRGCREEDVVVAAAVTAVQTGV